MSLLLFEELHDLLVLEQQILERFDISVSAVTYLESSDYTGPSVRDIDRQSMP